MIFGLDIGSFSCKIIQCQKRGDKFVLQRWGEIKTPVSPDAPDAKSQTMLAETIKKLVNDTKIEGNQVVTALPEKQVYSRIIQLPPLSEAELSSAIEFEAEQYIPLPLEKVQLEYTVLEKPAKTEQGAKMNVLLIAAQKEAVEQLVHLLDMSGLVPQALETEILAIERALAAYADTSLIVNVGNESSN
jgi:type IV pilus assembly protein PilM